ncbi:hypothetical protein DV515_00010005 [Chloebia gouldiae]|uniref:Septin-type G domain-containing protein n=1 Tax=Chloebia gouldiae TaxID=44316 RepID=A0A3L8SAM8_CHLGU|nr:hypothetical protein DV515_00010005 [Chloebia gouldiae]
MELGALCSVHRLSALKRSFEVEEVDQSSNSSTPQRRAPNTLLRSTVSSSTQKFQELGARNSEPSARHAEPTVQRSPKPPLRRVELSGPKLPEPVSRRTEISIDISSKQVENSTSALSRFGLKRADVGHKPPEPTARRTEITLGKPQEPGLRRPEASKIPEPPQRRAEPAGSAAPDAAPRRLDVQVAKAAESPATRPAESSEPALPAQPHLAEPKVQAVPTESPPKREEGECGPGAWCCRRRRELRAALSAPLEMLLWELGSDVSARRAVPLGLILPERAVEFNKKSCRV